MLSDPYTRALMGDYRWLRDSEAIVSDFRVVEVDPPAIEPVVANDAVNYSQINMGLPSNISATKIAAAREIAESISGRILVARTQDFIYDKLGRVHEFDGSPVRSIVGAWGTDVNNIESLIPSSYYFLQQNEYGGRLIFDPRSSWAFFPRNFDCMRIRVRMGYVLPCTADVANSRLLAENDYKNGDIVKLSVSGGSAPGGLTARGEKYYAVNATESSIQLALAPNGLPLTLTSKGTGQLFLGEVPDSIVQAILEIAASDMLSEGYADGQTTLGVNTSSLPANAVLRLKRKRRLGLG